MVLQQGTTMKKHLVYTGVFGLLYGAYKYIQGRSPMMLAMMVTPPATFAAMFFMCGLPVVIVWNCFTLPGLWKAHGLKGAFPFTVSIILFFLCGFAFDLGDNLRIRETAAQLPEYRAEVDRAIAGALRSGVPEKLSQLAEQGLWVAREHKEDGLGYAVIVSRRPDGVITARFLQSVTINSHHSMVLFRSDGNVKEALGGREHIQGAIGDNWWAIAD